MNQKILNNETLTVDNGKIHVKCTYTDRVLYLNELMISGSEYNWSSGAPLGVCMISGERENPILYSSCRCEKNTASDGTISIELFGILEDSSELTWTLTVYPQFFGFGMSASLYNPTDKTIENMQCLQPAFFEIKMAEYDVYTYWSS